MSNIIESTYELIEEIGSGGGGRVYLAYHKRLDKKVILKADKRKVSTREDLLRREVDVLKNLSHPYIPQVYDYFIENSIAYTVMEYIDGESLNKPLRRGQRFKQATVIKWAIQLLSALEYLHEPVHGDPPKGYVHSDIKPANLMLRPNGDICLIDFNISLALGEEYAVGGSAGYASPEHYGLDYSSSGSDSSFEDDTETELELLESTETELENTENAATGPERTESFETNLENADSSTKTESSSSTRKRITPDVRSDIYSVGATLYHLLSGKRPAKSALDVVPLSGNEFSSELIKIVTKAMNPNPDLRYQSAAEMLYSIKHIRERDFRYKCLMRQKTLCRATLLVLMFFGTAIGFLGLRRLQIKSDWLNLTNLAEKQFDQGDAKKALSTILEVYSNERSFIYPNELPESQEVLTKILGVYNQKDGFEPVTTIQLPSAPLNMEMSPNGQTALCTYDENLAIVDLVSMKIMDTLPIEKSAMSDAKYLNDDVVVYAGADGITSYSISDRRELWRGMRATTISVSADGSKIAAVYKDDDYALIYDAITGEEVSKVDFEGRHQKIAVNDIFIDPHDNLFALNNDGSMLAVSFSDGSLSVLNLLTDSDKSDIGVFSDDNGYDHYEGGFCKNYLAVAATNTSPTESVFIIIDVETVAQTGGFQSEGYYTASANENGIIVGVDNVLVKIDPETGEQIPLIDTTNHVNAYCCDSQFSAISNAGKTFVFDSLVEQVGEISRDVRANLLVVGNNRLLIGSSDSPIVLVAEYKEHIESELAKYDVSYAHDEARLSGDGKTMMYFSYDSFTICNLDGTVIKTVPIPKANEVYDQQFKRDGSHSFLEVSYYNGDIKKYRADNGELFEETKGDKPDASLDEEFETDTLRIESPLHGTPRVYDKQTGELVGELEDDAYLTYITEVDDYIVAQYMTTDNQYYGYLMNQDCERLAYLPGVCDVLPDGIMFDYHSGYIRKTPIFDLKTLLELANNKLQDG